MPSICAMNQSQRGSDFVRPSPVPKSPFKALKQYHYFLAGRACGIIWRCTKKVRIGR